MDLKASQFQTTHSGKKTDLFVLENRHGMQVAITNYGARIVSWSAADRNGNFRDIVLGFDSIKDYFAAHEQYHGATIGRFCNRIKDGTFKLNGTTFQLETNSRDNHLHGGTYGFHQAVWETEQPDSQTLKLRYTSADGEAGYPGTLRAEVTYALYNDNSLHIIYMASTDKETIFNPTNHTFFNLSGTPDSAISNHELFINADSFTPVNKDLLPTGEIASVKNTPFNFLESKPINQQITKEHPQLKIGRGFDHNFVLNKSEPGNLSLAASVWEPVSGRKLKIETTQPGLQFYTGNNLDGSDIGKQGLPLAHRAGFCLEPQYFPDSPNQAHFPSVVLEPSSKYNAKTIYRISAN